MRIEAAGGFVNAQGRVNGNLNLSRAIGDQQYKQDPELPPWAQVISAEPDMVVEGLTEEEIMAMKVQCFSKDNNNI